MSNLKISNNDFHKKKKVSSGSNRKVWQENCRKSDRKLSDYWRHALLNAKVTAIATPEDMAILRQIGSMANNLNQLAKKANEAGFKLVEWALKGLSKEIKSLYSRLSNDWRHN